MGNETNEIYYITFMIVQGRVRLYYVHDRARADLGLPKWGCTYFGMKVGEEFRGNCSILIGREYILTAKEG